MLRFLRAAVALCILVMTPQSWGNSPDHIAKFIKSDGETLLQGKKPGEKSAAENVDPNMLADQATPEGHINYKFLPGEFRDRSESANLSSTAPRK